MQIVGDPRYHGATLTRIQVTNLGHRPVTITTFGAVGPYPNRHFIVIESQPVLPCEITEGKYITSTLDQAGLDFSSIDYWEAWDSRGGVHKLREASRFKHWKSIYQRKRSVRKGRTQ